MMIVPQSLSPHIAARAAFVQSYAADYPTHAASLQELAASLATEQDMTAALTCLHRLQRVYYAAKVGVLDHADVWAAIDHADFPLWDRFAALDATEAQKDKLARLLYEGDERRQTPILLSICDYSRTIGERIIQQCVDNGEETDILISDPLFQRRLLKYCTVEQAQMLGDAILEPYHVYKRAISIRIEQTQQHFPDKPVSSDIQQAYNNQIKGIADLYRKKFYTLTILPTPKDAELDHIAYPDYIDLFFRMCDVDWDAVGVAHQVLIAMLNAASTLRMTNNDGTDVSMDITGFTFCDSRVAKNVPGSEVFSAPRRDSVQGVVVGKGRYLFNGKLMENIRLRFDQGRIVEYSAETGQNVLAEMVETDEDSHYIGEIGIGTNPVLRTHLVNGLLVEKIGGSFHLALGNCYKFTDYLGTPVHVNNGNDSIIHEDLTFMLYGKQGRMYVDGTLIMDDGRFLDPRLAVLNGGN
jgi:aminopeptidase